MTTTTNGATQTRGARRTKIGRVASSAMKKTIVVVTEIQAAHPTYGKTLRHSMRFFAHDERDEAGVGDLVRIMETRPISAHKRWRLVEILEKAK